jgi:WD40 repeat protein
MNLRWVIAAASLCFLGAGRAGAAEADLPIGQREPLLRVEGNGPTSSVTALAFSPDGTRLYAGGYDKVVRVWSLDKKTGRFALDRATYRVLVGPGLAGAINCLALSSDGNWLALGGLGVWRGGTDFRSPGFVFPQVGALTTAMREDQGMIYVYKTDSTGNKLPETYLQRGHRGPVLAMQFAPVRKGPLVLVSASLEWDNKANAAAGVLRVWDVRKGVCIASLSRGLPQKNLQPGLAVWSTGNKPDQLLVATAWGDGSLRLWEVERGDEGLRSTSDGISNTGVVYVPRAQMPLVTTSFQVPRGEVKKYHGRIQAWNVPDGARPRPAEGSSRSVPPRPTGDDGKLVYFEPRRLVALSAQGNGTLDHAAVLLRLSGAGRKDRLQIIDLDPDAEQFGQVKAELPLWLPEAGTEPVLAAAPSGRHLAVAGNKEHEVFVYTIAELLNNKAQPQVLKSVGVTMSDLGFVRNGQAIGLRMRPAAEGGQKQPPLVFDFTRRALSDDLTGWKKAGPDLEDWTADLQTYRDKDDRDRKQIVVKRQENRAGPPIPITYTQQVTGYALLPPMKPLTTALLALAYVDYDSGEAALALYDVNTGRRVRQLAGHVDPIRALAFSADGKLLASAAEDQTVCLWSLANLNQVIKVRGMLPGLAVADADGGVVVKQVKRDSPAFGKLEVGDLIQGLELAGGKRQALDSPRKFYETMWQEAPGSAVTLQVKGKQPVALQVGQGVDERNPLLSMFVTREGRARVLEWIAWSPLGYYDASAPIAERHLLWHFNKGKRDEPTATALTGQFRQEYWRQGLLKFLVARASLGGALEDWKKEQQRKNRPRPNLMMWIDELGPDPKKRDGRGRFPVRNKQVTLKLGIADFPFDEGDIVEWQWEDGAWQAFPKRVGSEWSADLGKMPWKRGTNRVRAILRSDGDGPQRFTEELLLSFQPPPPLLKYAGAKRQIVQEPRFDFKAEVVPSADSPEVTVTLSHKHEGKELLSGDQRTGGLEIDKQLILKPGLNLIGVVARNKDALKGAEELETARQTIEVIYTKKDAPPRISLAVESVPGTAKVPVEAGKTVVVHFPKVRLIGTIEAEASLTTAEWQQKDGKRVRLAGFGTARGKSFEIDEPLILKPGLEPTEVRFFANTASSEEGQATVAIVYRPELPRITLTAPADELTLYEGDDKPMVKVEGTLSWPEDAHPCKAQVLVNGKSVTAATLDKKATALGEMAALFPGDNRIQVRLTNEWLKTSTTETILVRYLRPPRIQIVADKEPLITAKPLALTARIQSAVELKKDSVRAEVNSAGGRRPIAVTLIPPADKEKDTPWTVRLNDIALDPGDNEVVLSASNVEASCRKPATLKVVYRPPPKPPKPPEVELVSPATDIKATKPDLTVRARIKSAGPLKRVDLIREGRAAERISVDLRGAKPNPQGFYEVAAPIKLVPQENVLRVEAVNADGSVLSTPVAVTYVAKRPVRVEIQHLIAKGTTTEITPLQSSFDTSLLFGQVPSARVWVVGQVTWDPQSDALLAKDYQIDVYVNGLRQMPVDLAPASGNERARSFRAEVSFTRSRDNRLEIELPPELKRSADNQPRCVVDCKKPAERQRVYLLPIAVGERDEKKLLDKIFEALQAQDINVKEQRFRTPAFFEGRLYGPLTGYVNRRQVLTQLNSIKQEMISQKRIDLRKAGEAPTDVLLLYFRGADSVASGKYEFRTSDRRIAIAREQLLKEFGESLGAQILLLDVDRQGAAAMDDGQRLARWPDDSRVSVLRTAWLDSKNPRSGAPFLLDSLAEAMRRAGKLGAVVADVKSQFEKMDTTKSKLAFDNYYPDPLAELPLGAKK